MNSKKKILIVDDSKSIRSILKKALIQDYQVKEADSGEKAIELLPDYNPDLVLLDIEMPGMNGYEVCKKIRSDDSFGFIKIIILSSLTKLNERLKGYNIGADDYLGKPFKEEELLAKVQVFLRLKALEDELSDLNNQLNEQVKIRTEQLIDSEKMAAVGRHTAGIIHNLNTPLQVILGNADILQMNDSDNQHIDNLKKAADQMKRIITTLLSTSRLESQPQFMKINLNEVIEDQIELLMANPHFKYKIKTELKLEPLPSYKGIYAHFSQSLGNLIKNSAEAMFDSYKKLLSISSKANDNEIMIEISDTGHGIPKCDLNKIFDPFYSTKPLTSNDNTPTGTGLGLASCKEMIESYNGNIVVESEIGMGTIFRVLLPLS